MNVRHKSELEMVHQEAIKFARAQLRLKHSILAEREINELLPAISKAVTLAWSEGRSYKLPIEKLLALPEAT